MCMINEGYRPEFWSEKMTKGARKEHKCEECGRVIRVGEPYWYGFGKFGKPDGDTYSSKTCQHCRIIAEWLMRNCNGFVYGAMVEDFQEHSEGTISMLRVVVAARRRWRSFADPAQLMPVPIAPVDMD